MSNPKILVVTLECGESEFEESKNSVLKQKDCEIKYVQVSNLPVIDAFNVMLSTFEKEKDNFDICAQIDADVIIESDKTFSIIHNVINNTPGAVAAQLHLLDYYTKRNIFAGLNFYVPKLNTFQQTTNRLQPDRSIKHHGSVLYSESFTSHGINIPAGFHCLHPSNLQSFHYGFHRGLKKRHQDEIDTINSYKQHNDEARKYAIMGFQFSKRYSYHDHEYTNNDFMNLFNEAKNNIKNFII